MIDVGTVDLPLSRKGPGCLLFTSFQLLILTSNEKPQGELLPGSLPGINPRLCNRFQNIANPDF
jgi:hypothetical protein